MKNSASSVTDLRALLNAEKALLSLLSEHEEMSTIAREILEAEGFTVAAISNSDVLHPIDGYNLIKRLGRTWPKVQEAMKLLVDKDRQEMDNVKNVDKVENVDEVDKVDRVDMMDNLKHMDKVDKVQKVDNVKHVDKVDKDKTKVDVTVSRRLVHQLGTTLEQFPPWEENRVCF